MVIILTFCILVVLKLYFVSEVRWNSGACAGAWSFCDLAFSYFLTISLGQTLGCLLLCSSQRLLPLFSLGRALSRGMRGVGFGVCPIHEVLGVAWVPVRIWICPTDMFMP